MKMELFNNQKINAGHWKTLQAICACSSRFAIGLYMVPRNSTQLFYINTTKFQVEREPV